MQAEREAPVGGTHSSPRRQAIASRCALPQETPVARSPSAPPALSAQAWAEAPAGAVEVLAGGAVAAEPDSSADSSPQPAGAAAARATIAIGTASLIGRRQTYPPFAPRTRSVGGRWPQTGQPGSGTTGSRLTSIVRRS